MKNPLRKNLWLKIYVVLLALYWLSSPISEKLRASALRSVESSVQAPPQNYHDTEGVLGVDSAYEIIQILRRPNGKEVFEKEIIRRVTRDKGWRVIVTKLPDHVSSIGEWEFVSIEDYSGTEVGITTAHGPIKDLKVGDPIIVWGRVWTGGDYGPFSHVGLNQATVKSREHPGWWAENGSRPFEALSSKQKALLILACLVLPILFVAWRNSR